MAKCDDFQEELSDSDNKSLSTACSYGNLSEDYVNDDEGDFDLLQAIQSRFSRYSGGVEMSCNHTSRVSQTFIEAIKKNRCFQKFIRRKMIYIEARMEEIKEIQMRVKKLREFQVQCKKKISRVLSLKQDARIQLISPPKKIRANHVFPMCYGPLENSHVACYRMALTNFPISFGRDKWTNEERQNLEKGIVQQFQEMLLQKSIEDPGLDGIISSITDIDITPEIIQVFSAKVNWERLASMYLPRRLGTECESRWLNYENRLISHANWTPMEDKQLLLLVQQNGINNWTRLAEKLKRTPFQCLARYQRSLNASILKREWTEDEDEQLRCAVKSFGESNWQAVACSLEGRIGTQCANRWYKTLHPTRQKVGKFSDDEDKRLRVAVTLFGHKSWHRIAQFVPGRTQAQCRERWVNVLDPCLNRGEWTQEDDLKLKEAILEHGYCWTKVAACVPLRTDNQCRRRWKKLFPSQVARLRAARNIQKAAIISNFVDRESERPALGPNDFVENSANELENGNVRNNPSSLREIRSRKGIKRKARSPADINVTSTDCGAQHNDGDYDITKDKKRMTRKAGLKKKKCSGNF